MTIRAKQSIWTTALVVALGLIGLYAGLQSQAQDASASSLFQPQAASSIPSSEMVGGQVGASTDYMRSDARLPRITRAMTVTTDATGSFSGTWTTAMPSAPTISLTPISASTSIDCQLTSLPTTTTFAGRCYSAQTTTLNLSIVTVGLSLNPVTTTPAGVSVQVIALPPTQ